MFRKIRIILKLWYRNATLPGFEGVPLRFVLAKFVEELQQDKIGPRASAISFNFMMALFPSIIFIFSLIPIIPIEGLQDNVFDLLQTILPERAFILAKDTIVDTISQKRVPLVSFVFLLMIIFATNGINGILKALSKMNPAFKNRSFAREYGVAMMLTIILSIYLVFSVASIIFSSIAVKELLEQLHLSGDSARWILRITRWFMISLIYFFGISIVFYFAPALHRKWRFISTGGIIATTLSLLASIGFAAYVNNFGQYNKLYGSLGAFIAIMIWIYINAFVILLGYEMNNAIRLNQLNQEK